MLTAIDMGDITLLTGGAGYIGRHLAAALLARGAHVRALDVNADALAPLAALGAETVVADAADPLALVGPLDGVTHVFHLAGSALGPRRAIVRANIASTCALAGLCAGHPTLRALVFASSGALYPSGQAWLTEATPPAPAFRYAAAKYTAEQVLLDVQRVARVPVRIARIAAVYGPDSPNLMLEQLRRGRFPLIGGGRGYASTIHIDDLVAALLALSEGGRSGMIYNLADDEPAPVRDFYGHLAALLGAPPPATLAPVAGHVLVLLINTLARLRGRSGPLPTDLVAMARVSHRMSNRRMCAELGLSLRYPSYRLGLAAALRS